VALQQLADLVLLTDTTGILTGEEQITIQGTNVAIQRETQRQRQLEFLQHTMNPVDVQIMGITGRGEVLRAVSQTIGLNGEKVVPSDDELQKKANASQQAQGPQQTVMQKVDQGIQQGVAQGVQQITSDVTQTLLAPQVMPGAAPGGGPSQAGPAATPPGAMSGTAGGSSLAQLAAQGQGNQPSPMSPAQGPQTHVIGSQPTPGGRPPPPMGGPE
jgi:hypothetical protein